MDCQDHEDPEDIPKSKRPRLEKDEEKEDTKLPESDFSINFRSFLSEHNVVVKDFELLLHHVVDVLGAENMADLEEILPDDLSEDRTGKSP
jgi:hypothetical protein